MQLLSRPWSVAKNIKLKKMRQDYKTLLYFCSTSTKRTCKVRASLIIASADMYLPTSLENCAKMTERERERLVAHENCRRAFWFKQELFVRKFLSLKLQISFFLPNACHSVKFNRKPIDICVKTSPCTFLQQLQASAGICSESQHQSELAAIDQNEKHTRHILLDDEENNVA